MRAFAAVEPSDQLRDYLQQLCRRIRSADNIWATQRWTSPENYHITLKFFGSIPTPVCLALVRDLQACLSSHRKFKLPISEIVTDFPRGQGVKLLMTAFSDPVGDFARLRRVLDGVGTAYGVPSDHREALPHITLARASRIGLQIPSIESYGSGPRDLVDECINVDAVSIFSSELTREGPRYNLQVKIQLMD